MEAKPNGCVDESKLSEAGLVFEYLSILDFLTNTEKDVSILVDKKIIVNLMCDANEVATMVNNLSKNVSVIYVFMS
ncbi:hypothetical protein RYX36_002384 [Vicia faba]